MRAAAPPAPAPPGPARRRRSAQPPGSCAWPAPSLRRVRAGFRTAPCGWSSLLAAPPRAWWLRASIRRLAGLAPHAADDTLNAVSAGGTGRPAPDAAAGYEIETDVLVVGGGTGGCAARARPASLGRRVVLTEETDWLGGQLTAQAVPPDEHRWIESFGCTRRYRAYRDGVRAYYRRAFPLTPEARALPHLNPGLGGVSRLCHEFRVGVAVLDEMLAFDRSRGRIDVRLRTVAAGAEVAGDRVRAVRLRSLESGRETIVRAAYVLDATELGDLLPMTGTEYVSGAESPGGDGRAARRPRPGPAGQRAGPHLVLRRRLGPRRGPTTRSTPPGDVRALAGLRSGLPLRPAALAGPHARLDAQPPHHPRGPPAGAVPGGGDNPRTVALALPPDRRPRALPRRHLAPDEVTLVNWPQNDYFGQPHRRRRRGRRRATWTRARQMAFSLLYWMQTEAPRRTAGAGWRGSTCART